MKVVVTLEGNEAIEYLNNQKEEKPKPKAKPKTKPKEKPTEKPTETKYKESDVKEALMELHSVMGGGV